MDSHFIIEQLAKNHNVFKELLMDINIEDYLWKERPDTWCLLEIVCHLYDEEREDFRQRTRLVLEDPRQELPKIDPVGWVKERQYTDQDYNKMCSLFLQERQQSVNWLKSLESPQWDQAYIHPVRGEMSAALFLSNWLAHDYLHIRQIIRIKYNFLKQLSSEPLDYAGNW